MGGVSLPMSFLLLANFYLRCILSTRWKKIAKAAWVSTTGHDVMYSAWVSWHMVREGKTRGRTNLVARTFYVRPEGTATLLGVTPPGAMTGRHGWYEDSILPHISNFHGIFNVHCSKFSLEGILPLSHEDMKTA